MIIVIVFILIVARTHSGQQAQYITTQNVVTNEELVTHIAACNEKTNHIISF